MTKRMTKADLEKLRKRYINNPPEGITAEEIRAMSDDELLDMDYFIHDDELDDGYGEDGFFI